MYQTHVAQHSNSNSIVNRVLTSAQNHSIYSNSLLASLLETHPESISQHLISPHTHRILYETL